MASDYDMWVPTAVRYNESKNVTHPSHKTRYSDSTLYDERCVNCDATDASGDTRLDVPCPNVSDDRLEVKATGIGSATLTMVDQAPPEVLYKYNETEILTTLEAYVAKTYNSHYVGDDNVQSLDLIYATGHGEGFCVGNILKYAARFKKKKNVDPIDDIMKVLHYAMLLLHDYKYRSKKKNARESDNKRTS